VRDSSLRDRLQMGTDRIHGNAVHELIGRFEYMPRLHHEFLKLRLRRACSAFTSSNWNCGSFHEPSELFEFLSAEPDYANPH
jgi:hypothetical protein